MKIGHAPSIHWCRDNIAKQVVEGVIGEYNHEYTTNFVLENLEKTHRGKLWKHPQ